MCLSLLLSCQRWSAGWSWSARQSDSEDTDSSTDPTDLADRNAAPPVSGTLSAASAATSAQAPALQLGQTADLPGHRVRLISQRDCAKPASASKRSAMRSWAAEIEVTNTGSTIIPVNPFYATLQDPERFTYTTSLSTCGALLPSRLLGPREVARGFVPFDLPRATTSVTLTYQPFLPGAAHRAQFLLEL